MNGKWARLLRQIGTALVAIAALATALTGWLDARAAKTQADNVGRVAEDLAKDPEVDHVYEALCRRLDELQRFVDWQQRRTERLTERLDWLARWSGEAPTTLPGESEARPEAKAAPRKPERIPAVKEARERRGLMIEQVQMHLTK